LLIFFVFLISTGNGLMYINNVGSLSESLEGSTGNQDTSVILISIFNAAGRIVVGFIADKFAHKIPRTAFLLVCIALTFASDVALIFSTPMMLPYTSAVIGFSYGGLFCLGPAIISLLFGVAHFGFNWGLTSVAPALGSLALNAIASALYDQNIDSSDSRKCLGRECYSLTFLVTSILCGIVGLLSLIIIKYTRNNLNTQRRWEKLEMKDMREIPGTISVDLDDMDKDAFTIDDDETK